MPTRTQVFSVIPWDGGLNTAVDSGLIPATDLTTADNIIFDTSGARIKRRGFAYFDSLSDPPAVTHRSSSGTTRTLVFASTVKDTGGTPNHKLVVGEAITVSGGPNDYNGTFVITGLSTTTATNDTITYTADSSLAEGSTATSAITVTRADPIVKLQDFFYFNNATNAKVQQLVAASVVTGANTVKLFRYDSSGRRIEIPSRSSQITAKTFVDGDVNTTTDRITITSHSYKNYDRVRASNSGGALPTGIVTATDYFVIYIDDNTIQLAISPRDVTEGIAVNITAASGSGTHTLTPQSDEDFSAGAAARVNMLPVNSRLIVTFDAPGVKPRMYDPAVGSYRLMTDVPDAFLLSLHAGRIWADDKTSKDYLHFSAPQDPFTWLGYGDSGAFYVGADDGDPEGLTAIFPSFKGRLIVTKRRRIYQIVGEYPENFNPIEMSSGVGSTSPLAVSSVDAEDMFFVSERGIHSVGATDSYGDFASAFISGKIQPTFNTFNRPYLKYAQAVYNPAINSVAFLVAEESQTSTNAFYLFNIEKKSWYRWPDVDARALCLREESDGVPKIYYGTSANRIVKTQSDELDDFGSTPIVYRIKTGTIYPSRDAKSVVGFKKLSLYYRPRGSFSITVKVKVDNFATQSLVFSQAASGAELGVDFTLGTSVLAFTNEFAPFTQPIDGFGRGCTITVEQSGLEEEVEIWGFDIEYEVTGAEQETKQTGVNE